MYKLMSNKAKNIIEVHMDDARCFFSFFFPVWQARNSKNNKIINYLFYFILLSLVYFVWLINH